MTDDLRSEGKNAETSSSSPDEKKTPTKESDNNVSLDVKKPESEVEKEWNSLTGSTQERIIKLLKRAKSAEEEKTILQQQLSKNAVVNLEKPPENQEKPEVSDEDLKKAVAKLRQVGGVATIKDLEALSNRFYLEKEHDRLKSKYSGNNDYPKYDSEEAEDHARTHGFGGNLEAAFKDLYQDEFIDAEIKRRTKTKQPFTEKPTASVKISEKPLTVETLRERLRQPDGADWWAKNREKIEPYLGKLSQK